MAKRKKVAKAHYVDNAQFLEAMIEYKKELLITTENNELPPQISEYLGSVFLKIAQRLSFRPNFINYTFKNDMISDGIENCLHYIHNFNPEKSKNPFAYFTQIIYYAFVRRIQKEKKQINIKYKLLEDANFDDMAVNPGDESAAYKNQFVEFLRKNRPSEELPKPKQITVKKRKRRTYTSTLNKLI